MVKQLDTMAEFEHYGTLKVAIELKSVPVVILYKAVFQDRVVRFFGFDSTYQPGKEKLTNLHHMVV